MTHMSIGDLESEVESAARDPSCDRGPGSLEDCNFPWFAVLVLNGPALALFTREGKSGRRHIDTDEVQRIFGPTVLRSAVRAWSRESWLARRTRRWSLSFQQSWPSFTSAGLSPPSQPWGRSDCAYANWIATSSRIPSSILLSGVAGALGE